jgi:hypothetical protein
METVRHITAEFTHEERIVKLFGERGRRLQRSRGEAPTIQSNSGHSCRCRSNHVYGYYRNISSSVTHETLSEAINRYDPVHPLDL